MPNPISPASGNLSANPILRCKQRKASNVTKVEHGSSNLSSKTQADVTTGSTAASSETRPDCAVLSYGMKADKDSLLALASRPKSTESKDPTKSVTQSATKMSLNGVPDNKVPNREMVTNRNPSTRPKTWLPKYKETVATTERSSAS